MTNLDTSLFLHINQFAQQTPGLQGIFSLIAKDGVAFFALLLLIGYVIARHKNDLQLMVKAVWAAGGTLIALALNQPLVHLFHASRPYTDLHNIIVLAQRNSDYGMPSDHATMAGAVTAGLFLVNPLLGTVALLAAVVLAFSRVYIAAHYPSQVLVGLLVGAVFSLVGYVALRKPILFVLRKVQHTPLAILIGAAHSGTETKEI